MENVLSNSTIGSNLSISKPFHIYSKCFYIFVMNKTDMSKLTDPKSEIAKILDPTIIISNLYPVYFRHRIRIDSECTL